MSWVGYYVPIVLILLIRCRHRFLPTAELDISIQCRVTNQISRLTFSQISAYVCILIKNRFNNLIIIQKLVFCCHEGSIQKTSLSQKKCLLSGAALDISSMSVLACPCSNLFKFLEQWNLCCKVTCWCWGVIDDDYFYNSMIILKHMKQYN